jgi:TctA family transporter
MGEGSLGILFQRPISAVLLIVALALFVQPLVSGARRRMGSARRGVEEPPEDQKEKVTVKK